MLITEKYKKEREKNKDKKLLMLGTANSCFDVDYNDFDEIWGAGAAFGADVNDIPKIDLGFEIHDMDQMVVIAKERNVDFNKYKCPILVQDKNGIITKQLIENPIDYPLDDIKQYVKEMGASIYFTSTFCYMTVYAAMMGYKDILFFKILFTSDLEYNLERPGLEYWIDMLGHRENINFKFPEDSELWAETILYGFEQRPSFWKLQSRMKFLWDIFTKHFHDCEALNGMLNRDSGIIEVYNALKNGIKPEDFEKVVRECRENINKNSERYKKSRDKYMQFSGALQTSNFYELREY